MKDQIAITSLSPDAVRRSRNRSLSNLFRMGHCAPTVMQTLLDLWAKQAPWLVRLTAGLPGGIGNRGQECGGITAPLIMLGLRHAADPFCRGLPLIFYKGHDYLRRFKASCGSTLCTEIRGNDRLPMQCIPVIRRAPELFAQTLSRDCTDAIPEETLDAYNRLNAHVTGMRFHCAHAVLHRLSDGIPINREMLDGTSAFIGGTVFTGRSCSAFAAGVMALGLALGEIENSRLRVFRMIATMAVGGDAFNDKLNAFNRTMNLGHRLGRWFAARFGSTRCRALSGCDFSTVTGVQHYIATGGVMKCSALAQDVADEVRTVIKTAGTAA